MKKLFLGLPLVLMFVLLAASPALAHDYDSDDSEHPLRYVAYALHPVGVFVEFAVTRPIHWLVSRPGVCVVLGHQPRPGDRYFEVDRYNRSRWELEQLARKEALVCEKALPECPPTPDCPKKEAEACLKKEVKAADAAAPKAK